MKQVVMCGVAGLVMGVLGMQGVAQTTAPKPAGVTGQGASVAPAQNLPKTPPSPFPPVDPKNFTAPSPTVATVNSFLHALWGFDTNRLWSVSSVEPTTAPGVVAVHVYVAETTQPGRVAQTTLFITPDGKHAIAGEVINFGAHPFEDTRTMLQQKATGPARGPAGKDLELVEFADLDCPACKAAQSTIDQLVQDFPQAHIVFEDAPQSAVHPFAFQAAAVGHCVRQAKGDSAFFAYAQKVYDTQAELTREKAEATLRAAAAAAGADPAAAWSCASTPATRDAVDAVSKLAAEVGVGNEPTLVINGRVLPIAQVPYDALQRVIVYQGSLDGITVQEQPSLKSLK